MSDAALERRCRWVARAYPDGDRADEVLGTLMESNAGRRAPRLGDALNVLWHGLATRLRNTAPGTRFGRWGDAWAVAVVTLVVMQTAAAAAITYRLFRPSYNTSPSKMVDGMAWSYAIGYHPLLKYLAALVLVVAAAATAATCLGRVRGARVLVAVTAVGGLGLVLVARTPRAPGTFGSGFALAAVAVGLATAYAVLFTGAVPRAVGLVPSWWWGMSAIVCAGTALRVVDIGRGPGSSGRIGVVLLAYCTQPIVLMLLALPLLRTLPHVFAAQAMLLVPAAPFLAYGWYDPYYNTPSMGMPLLVLTVTAVAWPVLAAIIAVTVRLAPKAATD